MVLDLIAYILMITAGSAGEFRTSNNAHRRLFPDCMGQSSKLKGSNSCQISKGAVSVTALSIVYICCELLQIRGEN